MVSLVVLPGLWRVAPVVFDAAQYTMYRGNRPFSLAPDGERLLVLGGEDLVPNTSGPSGQIILVQNWTDELQRLVPTP